MRLSYRSQVCEVLLVLTVAFLALALAGAGRSKQRNSVASQQGLAACIDDTDCSKALGDKGDKYACFLYLCYPWKDDSMLPASDKHKLCRRDKDCGPGHECHRHPNKRQVPKGLCFKEVSECEGPRDCQGGGKGMDFCCGGNCCEKKFFDEFKKLPCVSHLGCQDFGMGQFCCPNKGGNGTDICCDEDPNPTRAPPSATRTSSAVSLQATAVLTTALAAILAL